jgi:urease accessory protein
MFDGRASAWHAALALRFAHDGARTVCTNRHHGPLRMQKALYPEGAETCHAVVVHPPGGIAGGDVLELSADIEAGAHALITTPGAAKWYKANGRAAAQQIRLNVAGTLEWLPQEAIVFDAADVTSSVDIALANDASTIGWDLVALGRRAAGERFAQGQFRQSIRLTIDGDLVWHERTCIAGGDALLDAPVGLEGHHVFGCLWAAGLTVETLDLDELRGELGEQIVEAPVTRLAPRLIVARTRADSTAAARAALAALWHVLRPRMCGRPARPPRLWAT